MEIEAKYEIGSEEDYKKLLKYLGISKVEKLTNYYLKGEPEDHKWMIRLRESAGGWLLTIKGLSEQINGIFQREERELHISAREARELMDGRAQVLNRLGIKNYIKLVQLGKNTVRRAKAWIEDCEVAVDEVTLPDGTRYFELEVEAESPQKAQDTAMKILERTKVSFKPSSKGKFDRTLESLERIQ